MNRRLTKTQLDTSNKLRRGLWTAVWMLLFRPSIRPMHSWRVMLLRLFGARIGHRVRIYQSARIWAPWNLEMHDESCLGDFVDCQNVGQVVLGKGAVVSQYCYLCAAGRDYRDPALPLLSGPIIVGERAWIMADVFVAPGVDIGEGAVVSARSSVFRDVAPWTVVGGNPATHLRQRIMIGDSPVPSPAQL